MKRWLIPAGSLTAIVVALALALFVAGAFDSAGSSAERDGDADAEDAGGGNSGGDALGVCISEDDPNYDPDIPCQDTVVNDNGDGDTADESPPADGDGTMNMCIEGVADCGDMAAGDPGDCGGDDPAVCGAAEDAAVEASFARLAELTGSTDTFEVASVNAVKWDNACLGVEQPDVVCAEVITPGYIVVLDSGVLAYEFHTDTNGNAVLAAPAR
jgi:hypothetical protein